MFGIAARGFRPAGVCAFSRSWSKRVNMAHKNNHAQSHHALRGRPSSASRDGRPNLLPRRSPVACIDLNSSVSRNRLLSAAGSGAAAND